MMGSGYWRLGINVGLLVIRVGLVNLIVGVCGFLREEVDEKLWG